MYLILQSGAFKPSQKKRTKPDDVIKVDNHVVKIWKYGIYVYVTCFTYLIIHSLHVHIIRSYFAFINTQK